MAITFHIDVPARLVILTAEGPTSTEAVRESQHRLRQSPGFRSDLHQLFDFRNAIPTDQRTNQVSSLLDGTPFDNDVRRAYVVAPGVGFGLGRVAEALAEQRMLTLRIFEDYDEAYRWVTNGA